MDDLERQRLIADAILLERAELALARHRPGKSAARDVHAKHASAEHLLRSKAKELRAVAEGN
jgi:hypothetical protein